MKIFISIILAALTASSVSAAEETPSDAEMLQKAHVRLAADAIPLDGTMTILDSANCLWIVGEHEGELDLIRLVNDTGEALCDLDIEGSNIGSLTGTESNAKK